MHRSFRKEFLGFSVPGIDDDKESPMSCQCIIAIQSVDLLGSHQRVAYLCTIA